MSIAPPQVRFVALSQWFLHQSLIWYSTVAKNTLTNPPHLSFSGANSGGDCHGGNKMNILGNCALAALGMALVAGAGAQSNEIGRIKVAKGQVTIQRGGQTLPAAPGVRLVAGDELRTGADGSVGVTMSDNSTLSTGPNSSLVLDRYAFDTTTHQGRFDSSLKQGTLAVISGKIAKQSPEAMTVRTPAAILGVRGTEFVVSAADAPAR
jgi:hypothetical protein